MAISERLRMLVRAKKVITSCKTPAQIECAIKYKDIVLDYLFEGDEFAWKRWDDVLMLSLNERALIVTEVIDE
jgi:hypothetical protein